MNYSAFLSGRENYFREVRTSAQTGQIIVAPVSLNLDAATMRIAESKADRKYIREKGAFEVMRRVVRIEPLLTVRWKLPESGHFQLQVQIMSHAEDLTLLCLQSSTKAWYAIARFAGPRDPIVLSTFFSSCRAHDHRGFGFAPYLRPPAAILNHRPDLVAGPAAFSIYGHWLRWACRRICRSSGIYPIIPSFKADTVCETNRPPLSADALKRALIASYVERLSRHVPRKHRFKPAEDTQSESKANKREQIDFLTGRVQFLRRTYEESCIKLAQISQDSGDTKLAMEQVESLISMTRNPERKAYYLLWRGAIFEQLLDFEAAAASYGQAIAMEPTDRSTWYYLNNNMGYSLSQLGKHAEAEWYCRAAIAVNSVRYNAHKNLGVALAGQGEHARAARSLVHAVQLNPADPRALKCLVDLFREHSEIAEELPDIENDLEACRSAVRKRMGGHL